MHPLFRTSSTLRYVFVWPGDAGAADCVGTDLARFRRSLRQNVANSKYAGTIKTSHGMTATTTVISEAALSARTDPESRRASPIGVKTLPPAIDFSKRKAMSTATFSVSLARIFRWAVSLSNCDWTSVSCRCISTKSLTLTEGLVSIVRKLSLKLVRFLILASVSITTGRTT